MDYYLGHKIVKSAKIVDVKVGKDVVVITDEFGHTHVYSKPDTFARLRTATPGDFLVVYQDDYSSLSPAAAFVNGYTKLPVTDQALAVMVSPITYRTVKGVELQVEADTFDHYMVSFDVGYPVEATINNCADPKTVREGDVLVTYPTGRSEFLTRSMFEQYFVDAPKQTAEIIPPSSENAILVGSKLYDHFKYKELLKPTSKVEVVSVYDTSGDEIDFGEFSTGMWSKTNPNLMVVTGKHPGHPGRIIGYIDIVGNTVEYSVGISAMKVCVTF